MRYRILTAAFLLPAVVVVCLLSMQVAGQQTSSSSPQLPPISYVCPMPQDAAVVEDKPGKCPICKMDLVAVRLDSKWWCPTHQLGMVRAAPGKCPIDRQDLVQVTLSEYWFCKDKPNDKLLEPGRCANGQARVVGYDVRAHGDHNPRHDGQFFMAEDQWHHLEGTYPAKGLFRVYFYDNFTKPIVPKAFTGSVVVLGEQDAELGSFPLSVSKNGETLEAKLPAKFSELPLKAAALIKFDPKVREQKFNFVFTQHSKDTAPVPAAPATTTATPPAAKPAATASAAPARPASKPAAVPAPAATPPPSPSAAPAPARTPSPPPTQTAVPAAAAPAPPAQAAPVPEQAPPPTAEQPPVNSADAPVITDKPMQVLPAVAEALDESRLPTDTPGLLAELSRRAGEVEALVNEGNLSQVWLPATGTKTVALVLETHASSLPERQRTLISFAVKRIVTAAWELDAYGDLGNKQKLADAYARMATALTDLKAAYDVR